MKYVLVFALASSLFAFNARAISNAQIHTTLSDFCAKNKTDAFVRMSFACGFAGKKGEVEPLCEEAATKNTVALLNLDQIAEMYAKATGGDPTEIRNSLCTKLQQAKREAERPKCEAEAAGSEKIQRRWWNGQDWVPTSESLKTVEASAATGDPFSNFNLGEWHENGAVCVERDLGKAVKYYCLAYDSNFPMSKLAFQRIGGGIPVEHARSNLGKKYGCALTDKQKAYAEETKKLEEIAKVNLKKAEAGDVAAMVKVAITYQSSDYGLPQDFKKAFSWAEKAANKGSVQAMALIGSLYNRGDGVEEDDQKAFTWTLKAAQKGDLDSEYFIGICYHDGLGVEADLTKSVQWLSKAMDRGHKDAKDKLIEMYRTGELQAVVFRSLNQRLHKLEGAGKK